jgi:hypothetical protein
MRRLFLFADRLAGAAVQLVRTQQADEILACQGAPRGSFLRRVPRAEQARENSVGTTPAAQHRLQFSQESIRFARVAWK